MGTQPQLERFAEYRRSGDRAIRNALVREHDWIAVHCARRFAHRGEPMDDLLQVARTGLLKAVERFDPSYRVVFATFRDADHHRGASATLPRPHVAGASSTHHVKELYLELSACIEMLGHELGRAPRVDEIAEAMRASTDEVLEAMEAGAAYRSSSLTAPTDNDDDDDREEGAIVGEVDATLAVADTACPCVSW